MKIGAEMVRRYDVVPNFNRNDSGIQVTLWLLNQQIDRLQCWYY
jgi:hypothetical protein